jgi:adenine-specific DNA-methyltransferase
MRYIGNKTRLLQFIRRVLRTRGVMPGHAVDPFSGTASVARALKRWQFQVDASDNMHYGYVFARAYVEVAEQPRLESLDEAKGRGLAGAIAHLNALAPAPGFIHDHFAAEGSHARMYFTAVNAGRIDAMRSTVEAWHRDRRIDRDAYHVLLAAIIEAADRVANTTGVYASFVKTLQPNARRSVHLRRVPLVTGNGCHAGRRDAFAAVERAGDFELLYLDPPYNARQYAGYYHIPELLARGWFDGPVAMRGKAGLLEDREQRTHWCSFRHSESAFERLVASARCRHIVMSYSAEGIIPERTIERVLKTYGRRETYQRYRHRGYRRYRSDHDRTDRRYQSDTVDENLYCVSK